MPDISVILPTLNERQGILALISALHEALGAYAYEIIVVDDNSPDGTAEVVLSAQDPRVKVIRRTGDLGYARAIRAGITAAQGEILAIMDSDFNHDPASLAGMIPCLAECDCVSGSRFMVGGKKLPGWRRCCSGVFNSFVRIMTRSRVTDHLFGLFVIKKQVLARLPVDEIFLGFGDYGIRMLFFLQKTGVRLREVPAVHGQRRFGEGDRRFFRNFIQYTRTVFQLVGSGKVR